MSLRAATVETLDDWLVRTQSRARVPSLSVAVARGGRTVWSGSLGPTRPGGWPATGRTRYRIGSITKPVVAVAVLQLVAEGRVELEAPISAVLPEAPSPEASVAEYLCHTSGLSAEPPGPWWERSPGPTWDQLLATAPPVLSAPGRRHHYSNTGYAVLGRLLEVLDEEPWDRVVTRRVLAPLGMRQTGRAADQDSATGVAVHPYADAWHPEPSPDHRAMGPAGELWSTPADLVRLGSWTLGLSPQTPPLLPAELAAQMHEPRALADSPGTAWTAAHGLGLQVWNVDGRRRWGHAGSVPGFTADLRCDPGTGDVVALCASATHAIGAGQELLDLLAAAEPAPPQPWAPDPDQAGLTEMCGTWYWGPNPYTLTAGPAERPGQGPRLALAPLGPGRRSTTFARDGHQRWIGVEGDYWLGEELRPRRREDGTTYALDIATFHFTRTPYEPGTGVPGEQEADRWR